MIDWDYWPYLWLVGTADGPAIKDFNGWLVFFDQDTLGM